MGQSRRLITAPSALRSTHGMGSARCVKQTADADDSLSRQGLSSIAQVPESHTDLQHVESTLV